MSLTPQQILNAQKTADYDALCTKRELLEGRLIESDRAVKLLARAQEILNGAGFIHCAALVTDLRLELSDQHAELDKLFVEADDAAEEMSENLSCPACGSFNCADRVCQQINKRYEEDPNA